MSQTLTFDPYTHFMVNGIPTAYFFKKKCGRTGPFCFKKSDTHVDALYRALRELEGYRNDVSQVAIAKLRNARKCCATLENAADWGVGPKALDLRITKEIHAVLDERLELVATRIMGAGKTQNIEAIEQRMFDAFYDDVAVRPVWGEGRKLDKHYREERATTRHIPHDITQEWMNSPTQLSLNNWLDTVYKWKKEDCSAVLNQNYQVNGVTYLDAQTRQQYEITILGGRATAFGGHAAHTGPMRSITLGGGWGIYVMSFDDKFYLGEHTVGEFHHSSFMSGLPVKAAGEIAIDNGNIVGLTNKTGHYKARPQELNYVLTTLQNRQVNIANIALQDPFNKPNHWYTGSDALTVQCKFKELGASTAVKPTVV